MAIACGLLFFAAFFVWVFGGFLGFFFFFENADHFLLFLQQFLK